MICCPLDGGDYENRSRVVWKSVRQARKTHRCTECREGIRPGDRYECYDGIWDGRFSKYRTCLSCVEIRDHFACGNGWMFGEVWSQLEQFFFPDMRAGGPCLEGLTPAAKNRLFERRTAWYEGQ